jgi:hypothetical protein
MNAPEAYPQGYIEDVFKVRTQLAASDSRCSVKHQYRAGHLV